MESYILSLRGREVEVRITKVAPSEPDVGIFGASPDEWTVHELDGAPITDITEAEDQALFEKCCERLGERGGDE